MITVEIKKLHPQATIPKQATKFAGGWDVTVTRIEKVADNFVICWLGFALKPPNNYKVTLVPRSSITKTNWVLQNSPGLGDPDFTGEYSLRFRCIPTKVDLYFLDPAHLKYEDFPYIEGDRVGQLYLEQIIGINFEEIDSISTTERDPTGYGSTGNKQ